MAMSKESPEEAEIDQKAKVKRLVEWRAHTNATNPPKYGKPPKIPYGAKQQSEVIK